MNAFLISLSTCLLLAGSCSMAPPNQNSSAPPKGPWSIDYQTSGGFGGIGKGNLALDSQGKCSFSEINPAKVKSSVAGTLSPRQLQPVSDAVAKLDLAGWKIPGLNVAAPDAFGYRLEFHTGPDLKDVTTAQWYDNTVDKVPEDLKRLSAALEQTMKNRCGRER